MQGELYLRVSHRMALVPLIAARIHFGISPERILFKIDCGEMLWVWDIAVHQGGMPVSSYRIWARELVAPAPDMELQEVIECVVPRHRDRFSRAEVSNLLCVSRATTKLLVDSDELEERALGQGKYFVTRKSLERFLHRRWLGNSFSHKEHKEHTEEDSLRSLRSFAANASCHEPARV